MNNEMAAISSKGLQKTYGPGKDKVEAVKGIDLEIPRHSIYALLGPNGAGKTTLLSMLTTLIAPSGGSAQVAGFDVASESDQIRNRIGQMVFQDAYFVPTDECLPLWLCFVVVGAFAGFGAWFALRLFNRSVR